MQNTQYWIDENIPNLEGKIYLVTGANSGIGFEVSKVLAEKKATVIMSGRSEQRLLDAVNEIKSWDSNAKVETLLMDLMDLESVKAAAAKMIASGQELDGLINNAGIMATPYAKSKQGIESQFAVNHLAHFLLTLELMPSIKEDGRIINTSSNAHFGGNGDFRPHVSEAEYSKWRVYSNTKLANVLFTQKLNDIFAEENSSKTSYVVHPGLSATNLFPVPKWASFINVLLMPFIKNFYGQSAQMGALGTLLAATARKSELDSSKMYGPEFDNHNGWMKGYPYPNPINPELAKPEYKENLWSISEELVKDFV